MNAATPRRLLLGPHGQPITARDVARVRARAALTGNPGRAYDSGAAFSQDMSGWEPQLRSADAEVGQDRDRIVARARDLVRNDGWATGGINRQLDAMIGATFRLNARPDSRALRRLDPRFDATWAAEFSAEIEAEWRLYAEDPNRYCDAARTLTMTQLFRLGARHKMQDGEALGVLLWAPERIGTGAARYATTLQMVDPDRLSNPFEGEDTKTRRRGVEIDDLGAPIGYHIRRGHAADWYAAGDAMQWDYFPRETPWGRPLVVRDHDVERAGAHHGAGVLTPVLSRFKMLAKFDQVSLQAAVLRTLLGFFVKSPYDPKEVQDSLEVIRLPDGASVPEDLFAYNQLRELHHERHPALMGGVQIGTLAPGESIETVNGGGAATEFETFEGAFLRSIAAAIGSSAEEVSNDYRKVNYSSARAALLVAWRTLMRRRSDFAVGFATPVYVAWLEEAVLIGGRRLLPLPRDVSLEEFAAFRAAFGRCGWIGPGRGWVDPVKERQGELLGLEAGFGTLSSTCAEISGADWREVLEQRAVERAFARSLDLPDADWSGGGRAVPVDAPAERETEEQDA